MAINKIIVAFVLLIVGISLLSSVAGITYDATSKTKVVDEQQTIIKNVTDIDATNVYTVTNNPTGWKIDDACGLTSYKLTNSSGTAFTETTDYTFNAANGTFLLKNTTDVQQSADNLTYVSYSYCPDDYINLSWGRTVINMVGGFFALAILFVSLAMFYSIFKENGIVN